MSSQKIPREVRMFFWEYDTRSLSFQKDRQLIIKKILHVGDWNAICWLHTQLTNPELREWLISQAGAGLDPRRLRYWQIMLSIPKRTVDAWILKSDNNPWSGR